MAWKVTGKPWLSQAFQNELSILSLTQRDKGPEKNGVAGVRGNKFIYFDAL